MKPSSITKSPNGHAGCYKEVRFSPTATPIMRRAQSVPSNHHPAYSSHALGAQVDASTLGSNYLEHAQSLLSRQRETFETERTLFREERQLWDQERTFLKSKIAELESLLRSRGTSTVAASTSPPGALQSRPSVSFQTPFRAPLSSAASLSDPSYQNGASAQFWEGSSPGSRPTRVFPDDAEKSDGQNTQPEQGGNLSVSAPSLDAALSPKSHAADSNTNKSVPIEKLDSKLDGINLKSTALPPGIFARVMTPPSPPSRETSPSSTHHKLPSAEHKGCLKLKLSELGPIERRLVRDAGHTPMPHFDSSLDTEVPSPREDENSSTASSPLAPEAPRQPAENSDSYFGDLPDDPALKGPLSLLNDEDHDSGFLKELDQKLLDQAKQVLGPSGASKAQNESNGDAPSHGEQEPELKFKNTTNFGTAFGISNFGEA